ncbi:hypothetical protein [Streptomyces sp. S1D4-20]|uniref:hypothetical protein n=1 Tax=Streptomyces sp. S1D4-20 TaxID=2594462 RepID=UPI001162254C|nr:hypothetical protein [Streptomyces sp. S1D4-20]QDN54047.1 hypothetical protein FNV67_00255 [Streptomyces sp. S1D4-20]
MTTAPQPNRPADTSATVAELATILDTVALIRITEPDRSGRSADAATHWLTGVNRVTQIPTTRDGAQYEIATSGFSLPRLPGDHTVEVWLTPAPAPAPAFYAAPAQAVQQYAAAPQPQYVQPAAPAPAAPQPAAQPQPQYVPQPAAPQAPGERAAAPWMTPQPQAPTAPQQPAAPGYPAQGHYPQQPHQQGGAAPGMR